MHLESNPKPQVHALGGEGTLELFEEAAGRRRPCEALGEVTGRLSEGGLRSGQVPAGDGRSGRRDAAAEQRRSGDRLRQSTQLDEGVDPPQRLPQGHAGSAYRAGRFAQPCRQLEALGGVLGCVLHHVAGPDGGQIGDRVVGLSGVGLGLLAVLPYRGTVVVVAHACELPVQAGALRVSVSRQTLQRFEGEVPELLSEGAALGHEHRLDDQVRACRGLSGVGRLYTAGDLHGDVVAVKARSGRTDGAGVLLERVGGVAAEIEGAIEQAGGLLPRELLVGHHSGWLAPAGGDGAIAEDGRRVPVPGQIGGLRIGSAVVGLDGLRDRPVDGREIGSAQGGFDGVAHGRPAVSR